MAQFDRIYRLTIGQEGGDGVVIQAQPHKQGLEIGFDIDKDLTQQTNKCRVSVLNLSDITAKKIERDDSVCMLEVGYSEDVGLKRIFVGVIVSAWTHISGGEKVTEIELSDGQKAIRDCVVSLSYADNVSRKKVIDDIAAQMGILVHYADDVTFTIFANGFSFIGAGRTCLDKACAGSGLSWSIQNNILQVIKTGGNTNIEAIKLSASSGLIGSPERIIKGVKRVDKNATRKVKKTKADKKAGWRVTSLLQPTLNPGDLVYIESKQITGWYKVESLKHTGNYSGAAWYTELEVYEIGGTPKDGQQQSSNS